MRKICLYLAFFTLFLLLSVSNCFAENSLDVVINEIAWMGEKVAGVESKNWWRYEWLELYNNTQNSISLEGWKIELYRTELDWSLSLKGNIPAKSYFLIVSSDKISPDYDQNYSNLGGKFVNSGQKVLLKDGSGSIIDSLNCFSYGKWFAGNNDTKQTMERKSSQLSGTDFNNWQTSQNPGGTKKSQNSIFEEEKTQPIEELPKETEETKVFDEEKNQGLVQTKEELINYPAGIVFNEILPSPKGPDETEEWIEIFNQNDFEVDLSGWKISDTAGKTTTFIFPAGTKISAKGFLVLNRPITKITLNNDGDALNLVQPNGNIIDKVSFEKAPIGQSYNKIENSWIWSDNLTPGSENNIPKEESEKESQTKSSEEKGLAAVSKFFSGENQSGEGTTKFSLIFEAALVIAILSGLTILFLRKRLKPEN